MFTRSKAEQESHKNPPAPLLDSLQPIPELRPYFVALAAQVRKWAGNHAHPVKIGISSFKNRAAKSMVSFNLAASLARTHAQKILLIEAHFHQSGTPPSTVMRLGFTDYLTGDVDLHDCVMHLDALKFDVLPQGTFDANTKSKLPLDLLGTIIEDQMFRYDIVVLELPTVGQSHEYLSLSSQMHGVILVVEGSRREKSAIAKVKSTLTRAGTQLIGLVIHKSA